MTKDEFKKRTFESKGFNLSPEEASMIRKP
jgi:hypothetical protein